MAKTIALVSGIVFILIALLGFIQGDEVLGLFHTNTAHDLVHLISGIILLGAALGAPSKSALALKIVGFIYLLVTILGFVAIGDNQTVSLLGIVNIDAADNWLHLVLSLAFIAFGFLAAKADRSY